MIKIFAKIINAFYTLYIFEKNVPSYAFHRITYTPVQLNVGYNESLFVTFFVFYMNIIWVKVFKNGPSKICGREPLRNLK